MATIFTTKNQDTSRQIRLSLPEAELSWLERQAEAHGLSIHEAATQALHYARSASEKPARRPKGGQ